MRAPPTATCAPQADAAEASLHTQGVAAMEAVLCLLHPTLESVHSADVVVEVNAFVCVCV